MTLYPVDIAQRGVGVNFVEGQAMVKVWAPKAQNVQLKINSHVYDLNLQEHGFWTITSTELLPGAEYFFVIDGKELADPASLCQPKGVHGPSRALDITSFPWTDRQWTNSQLDDYIIYEIHVGTFTGEGNFQGVIDKLPYLRDLGITAVEIMPVAQFPGDRNWGYDGVFPFAVHTRYGGAEALQQLVNSCHAQGIAVILDVVYNHFGPEGNYFSEFGPYFTSKYKTPWGDAINFDDSGSDAVRQFFIENALMWFRDFHIDALRLDAVHAIKDFSPVHILKDIRLYVDKLIRSAWRMHYLIAEVDLNDTRFIESVENNGYGMDAQWADEFHHALRVTTGQERNGYYSDFDGIGHLAKAYRDAYVYDGQYSEHRAKFFGVPADNFNGNKFVVFSQNHDQIGNRMLGERTSALLSFDLLKVMAGATLLSPYIPLLFMGEEYGEKNPFQYFVHHSDPTLIENVRKGRKAEFAAFHEQGEAPDPQDQATFENSTLQWKNIEHGNQQALLLFYKELIALRKTHPALRHPDRDSMDVIEDSERQYLILHRWHQNEDLWAVLNFSGIPQPVNIPVTYQLRVALDSGADRWKGAGSSPEVLFNGHFIAAPESVVVYIRQHD